MMKTDRVMIRPTKKADRQAVTDARVLEAWEREEAQGMKHPEHIKKLKAKMKQVKPVEKLKEAKKA